MSGGTFFFVVGSSGAGKDSLIDGARASLEASERFAFAQRVITRPAGAPGEDHLAMDAAQFAAAEAAGSFLITWQAHGLHYGLPGTLLSALKSGKHVIANGSRAMVRALASRVPRLVVIEVTAPPEVLAARIKGRGRETEDEIKQRLTRQVDALPADIETLRVVNDSDLEQGIQRFIFTVEKAVRRPALIGKANGGMLDEVQYGVLLRDIIEGRYAESEIAPLLVTATEHMTDTEVLALAKVRAGFSTPIRWDEPIVVDKHSMGGIPGSRITLIVVPIVAAFGLAMPKTSSRAITSAAGTADAMEVVAKVDLDVADVQRCVAQARACIAWNGRLNHSIIDDVMNAITRPLAIDSNRWSVASILSKKLTAGSTHVIVDLPFGPRAKLKTHAEARALADLFETTGAGMGLQVKAFATDGSRPIGRGIGPALEVRDVEWVLDGHPEAPADLREKALFFASRILAWDPSIGSEIKGREVAERLLKSGAARAAFEKIIDAQGRRPRVLPGRLTHIVKAAHAGIITAIDGFVIAGIARRAGAPQDKGAGIDLLYGVGQAIQAGQPLFVIHADNANDLESAATLAALDHGYVLAA
jgi:thymidine phosphorylase